MQFLVVKPVFLYPVCFTDRVEVGNNLLPLLTTQTLTYLLQVGILELSQLFKLNPLIVTDTLNLFRIIQT